MLYDGKARAQVLLWTQMLDLAQGVSTMDWRIGMGDVAAHHALIGQRFWTDGARAWSEAPNARWPSFAPTPMCARPVIDAHWTLGPVW